ncbi:hypothetical protein EAS64_26155 [Trebonia kvetii]|uniref:Uncharacterized protein n=1 Tax=Trebonia kvetii TaxID=2480626 RepID=A0A6P2BVG4_9ACTN|nr:hypothetical protein [Trebonia kvetii]TVZ02301.1 hypothetical protein EAS64_26155 [Trebonia kvetii]
MVSATVGGRPFDFSREEIERRMRGIQSEPIREHLVEVLGTVYPPKQVLATITGWDRTSFTTMEAQRVLSRVGFVCRRAGTVGGGRRAWVVDQASDGRVEAIAEPEVPDTRLTRLETQLAVAQEAIASLAARVQKLELAAR